MLRPEETLPEWLLERYRLGELPAEQLLEIRERLVWDDDGRRRLQALQEGETHLLNRIPPRDLAAEVQRRLERPAARRFWRWMLAVPAVAALLVTPFLLPSSTDSEESGPHQGVREKGPLVQLRVFRKVSGGIEELGRGDEVRAGDVLQLGYVAHAPAFGAVVSVDGGGGVTLHFPAEASASTALQSGGTISLPFSFALDTAPAFERFFLISSAQALDVSEVLAAAAALALDPQRAREDPLLLPRELEQIDLLVNKPR